MFRRNKINCSKTYLGIDCGSVSVKMALLDENNDLIAESYLENQGIKDTIIKGLKQIRNQINNRKINGAGATGSGREFAKILLNADLVKTEILAHVTATKYYFPDVRTVMDIGGEDAKLILLNEQGIWINYVFNNICGAGTGSMLVNIANNLNIKVDQIDKIALKSRNRLNLPAKCGVLLNSAVITYKNRETNKEDIIMAACRALIKNYMFLARNLNIEPPYVFQGATAKNKALVKVFEEELKEKINTPEHPELMGAIGMALLCNKENIDNEFNFDLSTEYTTKNITGQGCPNNCQITILYKNNKKIGSVGNRCMNCVSEI